MYRTENSVKFCWVIFVFVSFFCAYLIFDDFDLIKKETKVANAYTR